MLVHLRDGVVSKRIVDEVHAETLGSLHEGNLRVGFYPVGTTSTQRHEQREGRKIFVRKTLQHIGIMPWGRAERSIGLNFRKPVVDDSKHELLKCARARYSWYSNGLGDISRAT